MILCIEPVNHLYHIGVRDVTKELPQSMLEKSGPTEGTIEPTVPRLAVKRGHVVGVTIELVRDKRRDRRKEFKNTVFSLTGCPPVVCLSGSVMICPTVIRPFKLPSGS